MAEPKNKPVVNLASAAEGAEVKMTDDGTLPDRLRNMVRNPNAIGTHSAACWQWHDDCALLLAADRVAERDADVSAGAVARTVAMSHIAAERDAERAARERAEAEARRLRELTEGDPYSIYHEAAEMRSELMHLRRWKLEATEVIESWERAYEALGDVGGLGQRRSDAVLAEVLRMKAELDRAQLRLIEASNPGIDMDEVRRVRLAYPDPERHETVSRAKYGASLALDIAADGGAAVAEGAEDRGQTE